MANRYGKGDNVERFNSSGNIWQQGLGSYEEMLRKEQAVNEATRSTAGFESQATRAAQQGARARAESADLAERAAAASERSAKAARLEADAIRQAAAAREQAAPAAAAASGRRPLDVVRGATDPLIYQAYGVGQRSGQIPSQYALRNELGIGSYRARDLTAALTAGSAPVGATPLNVRQAQIAAVEADAELATANKKLASLRRTGGTKASIDEALTEQELAQANAKAAKARIEQEAQLAEAHQANIAAISRATAAQKAAAESAAVARARGDIILHPDLGGKQAFAPISQPRTYGDVQEVNPYASGRPGQSIAQAEQAAAQAAAVESAAIRATGDAAAFAGLAMQNFEATEVQAAAAANRAAVIQRLYSDEMHRHGALTAEFIQATARGEVTLREFGNEMLVTIGKFAGWTAAATAVYGAFKVISDIKTGAIAAQSAVEGLTRFMPTLNRPQAYEGILGLSRHTNVGVQDVGDVAQVFARRYNNPQTGLTDTLTATRTALLAYKLDQISTADSTRFLMAITQEWQVSAQRLPGIFDQISTAQRKFGARVSETLPALARSSSAVKNAGGDINQLIALLALAQVRTGQTGNTVGTAFLRGASNFFRSPKSVAVERGFGLNPEEGFTQFLIDAIKRSQTLNGPDRTALAKAIGGPQYGARIFQSLLNAGPQQVQRFVGGTSPEATRGAAEKELTHVLAQADQQLQQMGHTLQRIGGYLASSGLLTFAGVMLHGINDALGALELMLRLFNELPKGLSTSLALMGEMVVTMRLLSRFGIAQRLQQIPIAGAFVQPGARLRQQALNDQHAVVDATKRQLESDVGNLRTASFSRDRFIERARPLYQGAAAELQAGVDDPQRRVQLQASMVAIQQEALARQRVAAFAESEVQLSKERLATEEANLAEIKAANARNIEALLAQRGIGVTPLRGTIPPGEVPAPIPGAQFLQQTEARGALVTPSERGAAATARIDAAIASNGSRFQRLGRSGQLLERGAQRTSEFAGRAITSVERAGAQMGGLATRFAGFAAALGPLDYALIGIPVGLEVLNQIQQSNKKASDAIKSVEGFHPTSTDSLNQFLQAGPKNWAALDPYLARVAEFKRIGQLQSGEQSAGRPLSSRFSGDIAHDINNTTNAARAGLLSQAEITRALNKYRVEVQTAYEPTKKEAEALRAGLAGLAEASANINNYRDSLSKLSDKDFSSAISGTADTLQQFGPQTAEGKKALRDLRVQYEVAAQRWGPQGDSPDISLMAAARQHFLSAASQAAQQTLQDGLLFANNEADRSRAFSDAQRAIRDQLTTPARSFTVGGADHPGTTATTPRRPRDAAAGQLLREQRAQIRDQRYQDEEAGRQIQLALLQSQSADTVRNSRLAVEAARKQVDTARQRYGRESRQYMQALTALNQARQQQAGALLSQIQAEGALAQARAGNDPAAQAQAAVQAAQRALAFMRAHSHQFDPTAITQAEATLVSAENQRADQIRQDALDLTQLRGEIAAARLHGDPVAQARAALGFAREERAKARTEKERLQATLDLINANNDLQSAITQREQDRFQFLESLTTDPVKQAGYEVQRAALAVKSAKPGTDAWYQAQSQYHQALQQQHSARLQSQEDDIDFQLQMEQITRDDAIKRYQQLLHLHNLSKQERRDLLLKIHQLQKDEQNDANGFALRVGNVKLPTVYDVRRAIAEGRRGNQGSNVNVNNHVQMSVTVSNGADVQGVFAEFDRQVGTSVSSGMRAAGLTL